MPRTITARENDRNGFKIVGNLKERGKVVDLTGFAVFYEAISPLGFFVRDIAVITNFRDGVFEYTVSKEAVSSAGVWVGYFAFEKGTERFTTQDIRISLGSDVKSGSVQLENYIAEFDKLKKRIDTLQIAVDKADIVKRTGDTMTGTLIMANAQVGGDMVFNNAGGRRSRLFIDNSNGGTAFTLVTEKTAGKGDWDYTEHLRIGDRRNWMKNSGDTMTGNLIMDNDKFVIFKDTSGVGLYGLKTTTTGALTLRDVKNGKDVFYASGNDFVVTADFKTKNDTDWIPLTLLNGVKQQSSQPASAVKRSGNVVNIVCAITDFKDKQVIANVPAIFRPDREMLFTCNYFQGLVLKNGYVIIKPNGDIYLEGLEATVSLYRFSLTYIV
nr:BppU family phage baseplate upper protein [Bacillus wiedmannii]